MNRFLDNCKKLQIRAKKRPKMLILANFFTKNELHGQNDHSIPKPLLCLKVEWHKCPDASTEKFLCTYELASVYCPVHTNVCLFCFVCPLLIPVSSREWDGPLFCYTHLEMFLSFVVSVFQIDFVNQLRVGLCRFVIFVANTRLDSWGSFPRIGS